MLSQESFVEIADFSIILRPTVIPDLEDDCQSMLESMWSSMSSSIQLARDCMEKSGNEFMSPTSSVQRLDGLESFAKLIDNGMYFY